MEMLKRAWSGEERLWKVWWLIGLPIVVVIQLFGDDLINFARSLTGKSGDTALLALAWFNVFAYIVWAYAAWRCSPNVSDPQWKWIARVLIVACPVASAVQLYRDGKALDKVDQEVASQRHAYAADHTAPLRPVPLGMTAWSDKAGFALNLDSHWRAFTPVDPVLPESTSLFYEGDNVVAAFSRVAIPVETEAYGAELAPTLHHYRATAFYVTKHDGRPVWVAILKSTESQWPANGVLAVYRDYDQNMWRIFIARPTDGSLRSPSGELLNAVFKATDR